MGSAGVIPAAPMPHLWEMMKMDRVSVNAVLEELIRSVQQSAELLEEIACSDDNALLSAVDGLDLAQ